MRLRNAIIGIVVLAAVIGGAILLFSGGGDEHNRPSPTTEATEVLAQPTDTPANTVTATRQSFPTPPPTMSPVVTVQPTTAPGAGVGPEVGLPQAMVELASVPLVVRDVSGQQIGDGTVRYYAPDRISYPDSIRIELEIDVDRLYITPAPDNRSPVPFITVTPRPDQATPTERVPSYENSGMIIAQRMGASLICNTQQFSGCSEDPDVSDAKIIDIEDGASWSWIIAPREGVTGTQDLLLEIWMLQTVNDGPEQPNVIWMHSFKVVVSSTPVASTPNINSPVLYWVGFLLAIIVIAGLIAGGTMAWQKYHSISNQPKVFLSYQRKTGWAVARTINDRLRQMGAEVFIDVDDINEGRFANIIEAAIQSSEYFVPVLAPGTLESAWVRREIATALKLNKVIIPVLVSGFMLENLPPEIADLSTHNAVTMTPEYFEAGMDKLARCVGLKTE